MDRFEVWVRDTDSRLLHLNRRCFSSVLVSGRMRADSEGATRGSTKRHKGTRGFKGPVVMLLVMRDLK
ncbi:hypothetical protein E2C01_072286 [Portunus trituberculatus]|uniref:Uncharacterized protein n=1 Tax=Portunus trituberculatus TaxID=210409 RepID=A0A5B7I7D0_PORTR|nr:hypothetical protein [Portunus trituberculatus]